MQNNSAGMVTTSVPVAVVPNAPRCPSWKIHTSAPNVAVSDKPLSTSVFSGNITLPVIGNISTNVIAAMTARTMGTREVTAWAVSRLIGVVPVRSACRPAGPGTACSSSSCVSEACEYSGAVLVTVRKALPSLTPGRGRGRSDKAAADERPIRRRHRRHRGHLRELRCVAAHLSGADPVGVGNDNGHVRRQVVREIGAELITDLARRARCR